MKASAERVLQDAAGAADGGTSDSHAGYAAVSCANVEWASGAERRGRTATVPARVTAWWVTSAGAHGRGATRPL